MSAARPQHIDRSPPATYDHVLGCLAGFFATEDQALAARHELQVMWGLQSTQEVLLSPPQSGWLPFTRQACAWALSRNGEGRSRSDAPLMALLAGFAVTLAVALWPILGDKLGVHMGTRFYLLMPIVGAGAGWAAAVWLPFASQYRRFDRSVRRQLSAGRWVLLTHGVPRSQQGDVLELLRSRAVGWCVVSGSRRRL